MGGASAAPITSTGGKLGITEEHSSSSPAQTCGTPSPNPLTRPGRIWRWRSQYGEVLGGLGTGIGDGDRGVICGREEACCAAKEREQEVDCDAADAKDNDFASWADLMTSSPAGSSSAGTLDIHPGGYSPLEAVLEDLRHEQTLSPQLRSGYERHEIEGIGGVVKRKLVRMVRVGACVPEWEDERGVGKKALMREASGDARSWCGWCWRVVLGQQDRDSADKFGT